MFNFVRNLGNVILNKEELYVVLLKLLLLLEDLKDIILGESMLIFCFSSNGNVYNF